MFPAHAITVADTSWVWVAVMLWAAIGWPAPIVTFPIRTARVGLRLVSTATFLRTRSRGRSGAVGTNRRPGGLSAPDTP